jgi:hypothetical protein
MSRIKQHLSPGLVIGILALCVALGGTAFALGRNSVGARELKPTVLREKEHVIAPHTTGVIDVKCRRGQQLIGGGVEELGHPSALDVEDSHPRRNGWEGSVTNNDNVSHDVDAEALCLKK